MVNEKKEAEKEEPKDSTDNSKEGDQPEATSVLDRVIKENERMEANIKRQEEIISKQEEVAAKQILAGRAEAGRAPEQKKEETPGDYTKKVMAGEGNE